MANSLVWTNHLESRLRSRGISYNEAFETVQYPHRSLKLGANKWKLFRDFASKKVVLVAVFEKGQWVVLTGWTKPVSGQAKSSSGSDVTGIVGRYLFGFLNWLIKNLTGRREK